MYYARYICIITSSCNFVQLGKFVQLDTSEHSLTRCARVPETRNQDSSYSTRTCVRSSTVPYCTQEHARLTKSCNVYMCTPAVHAVLSQRVIARASPLESHSPCAHPCISLVALTASPLIRSRRNLVKRSEKKFHDERARFERVRRARRVAVCGFRKSLIHPPVLGGWENV